MEREETKKQLKVAGGIILVVLLLISLTNCNERRSSNSTQNQSSSYSYPAPAPSVAPIAPSLPDLYSGQEKAFVASVLKARNESTGAANDLQRGSYLSTRNQEICRILPNLLVNGWVGEVSKLSANSDGKGVLQIQIAPDVIVKTWNNSFSDIGDHTLIEPQSTLYQQVVALREGEMVRFSGRFISDQNTCIRDSSMSLSGKLKEPEFIFKFDSVSADIKSPAKPISTEQTIQSAAISEAPSFDCAKAKSVSENLICTDLELAKKDRDVYALYLQAKAKAPDQAMFKQQTVAAWKYREENCTDKACLFEWFENRQTYYLTILNK